MVTLGSGGKILLASDATPSSSIAAVMGISHSQASEMGADTGLFFFPHPREQKGYSDAVLSRDPPLPSCVL